MRRKALEPIPQRRFAWIDDGPVIDRAGEAVPSASADFYPSLAEVGFGVRLLALAVVAGAGALLPLDDSARVRLIAGIVAGAILGLVQHRLLLARRRHWSAALVPGQVLLWTALLGLAGGQRSPLFAGYLLEVTLAGALYSRAAAWATAGLALLAFAARAVWIDPPLVPGSLAYVAGFTTVGTILTSVLVDLFRRQRARLREYHRALLQRASTLSDELRLLGDYLGAALVVLDDLGRVVSVNAAGARLLGVPREPGGVAWQEVLCLDPEGAGRVARAVADGEVQRGVLLQHTRPDGRTVPLRAEMWVHPDPEGRRTYLLLAETRGEERGDDPLRRLGEAVACVAHQFRNSVHALQSFAGDLRVTRRPGAPADEQLEGLLGVISSLGDLSRDVLAMASPASSAPEELCVAEILRSSASLARTHRSAPEIALPAQELSVRASRGPLVHALFNLIDNACRVSPPGDRPLVRADARPDGVGIWIEDRGPGLPASHPAGSGADPKAQGAGYGLVAARRFIEASGGVLTFSGRPGGGTSCLVLLPAGGRAGREP